MCLATETLTTPFTIGNKMSAYIIVAAASTSMAFLLAITLNLL